jgi:hypothetical protein
MRNDTKNAAGKTIKSECYRNVNTTFTFEPWMIKDSDKSVHHLGAAFMLAGIKDDEFVRLSYADQKTLWGKPLIGKQAIAIRNGHFIVIRSVSYGSDFDTQYLTDIMKDNGLCRTGYSDLY